MKYIETAKRLNKLIELWTKDAKSKLVVGIDGYTCSGKSTVTNLIAEQNTDVSIVHLDCFVEEINRRRAKMEAALDKSEFFYNRTIPIQ